VIKFVQIVPKKVCKIFHNGEEIADLELSTPSSISNKFNLITDFVEDMSEKLGNEFEKWFVDFFTELHQNTCNYCKRFDPDSRCVRASREAQEGNKKKKFDLKYIKGQCYELPKNEMIRKQLVTKNIENIKKYVDQYLDQLNFDYSIFVNKDKIKKTSIVFSAEEIKKIMRLSSYLKVYSIISNSENLKLDMRIHKKIFNQLLEGIDKEIIDKIFEIIRTKTFRYKQSDKFMWEYIKLIQCKEIDIYIVEIFNFLMNNIMVLCQLEKNPITYFVTVVDTAIIWILRSVYKASIIYSDEITSNEIQTIRINNLKSYSYNDTLGRIKIAAYEWVYRKLEEVAKHKWGIDYNNVITDFHNRMKIVRQESPLINSFVYPLLSNLTGVPYKYFQTLDNEQALVLSSYLRSLLSRAFDKDHQYLFRLLDCYPDPDTHVPSSTSYIVKQIGEYVNLYDTIRDFMGFDTCGSQHDIYGHMIGRLIRIKFRDLFTGDIVMNLKSDELERDIILFYTYYFAGVYNESFFKQIRNDLSKLF